VCWLAFVAEHGTHIGPRPSRKIFGPNKLIDRAGRIERSRFGASRQDGSVLDNYRLRCVRLAADALGKRPAKLGYTPLERVSRKRSSV
jgi:hypothetical protein